MVGLKNRLKPAEEVAGGTLQRFSMMGKDGVWVWGDAHIQGDEVIVSSSGHL